MEQNRATQKVDEHRILQSIGQVEEHRKACRIIYPLNEVLFLVFSSCLCGLSSFEEIVFFGHEKLDWLRQYLPYKNGIPSHDTINRLLGQIKVSSLSRILSEIFGREIVLEEEKLLQIDGKRHRGSATIAQQQTKKSDGGKQLAAMVNLYSESRQLCLASVAIDCNTGEVGAVEALLNSIEVKDATLSLDAGFCQISVVEQIVAQKADYFIRVKENQPKLLNALQQMLGTKEVTTKYEGKWEDINGRKEKRDCVVIDLDKIAPEIRGAHSSVLEKWTQLRCIVRVDRHRTVKRTQNTSFEQAYFIVSKAIIADKAQKYARQHWGIENKLHWQLDVLYGEDADRKREGNSTYNMSLIRKIVMNIHQKNRKQNKSRLKDEMLRCLLGDKARSYALENM